MASEISKGQLLVVKVPPYYNKEYFYEVESAGKKLIRAKLYHSPKVRKSWTKEEFGVLLDMQLIRLAEPNEKPPGPAELPQD
jgi:hypothetical protein